MFLRIISAAFVLFSVSVIAVFSYLTFERNTAQFTISNQSDTTIVSGRVAYLDFVYSFKNIKSGESEDVTFTIKREGGYHVQAELASGHKLSSDGLVYLTNGMDSKVSVIVLNKQITLSQP